MQYNAMQCNANAQKASTEPLNLTGGTYTASSESKPSRYKAPVSGSMRSRQKPILYTRRADDCFKTSASVVPSILHVAHAAIAMQIAASIQYGQNTQIQLHSVNTFCNFCKRKKQGTSVRPTA